MPGSVANASPTMVLPQSLCRAFTHSREYPIQLNEYANGESQRSVQSTNSRKRWRIDKKLPSNILQELRTFYDARKGPLEPFYFYDPYETDPKFSHDPTGATTAGRYIVRFEGGWQQTSHLARLEAKIELVELA